MRAESDRSRSESASDPDRTLRQATAIHSDLPTDRANHPFRAAGKPAEVAIVAIMRKLVIIANALLRDNRKWTREMA
jgi:magnesium-transporting ATPase (P-type)